MDGQVSDLLITVRTGNGQSSRPTMKGGPIDQRPGVAQSSDSSIRIGIGQRQPSTSDPMDRQAHISNEVGPSEDMFVVYRVGASEPLDSPPVWRYIKKDCLRPSQPGPLVPAVEEFRKLIAEAEKPKVSKTP